MNWSYTNIQHGPRLDLGLTPNEYCVLDVYYQTQASPIYSVDGWSENTYQQIHEFLGFSKGAIHKMVNRFVDAGLMEVNPANPKQKKTTELWYLAAYERVQKVNSSKKSVHLVNADVHLVNESRSLSERHRKEEREYKEEYKERGRALEISLVPPTEVNSNPVTTQPVAPVLALDEKYPNTEDKAEVIYQKCIAQLKADQMLFSRIVTKARINITKNQFVSELRKWIEYYIHDSKFFANAHRRMDFGRGNMVNWLSSEKTRDQYSKLNAAQTTGKLVGESPFAKLAKLRQAQQTA